MEQRGWVNLYVPAKTAGLGVYTINLANGTTPYITIINDEQYVSTCYQLATPTALKIHYAWYRPTLEEFVVRNAASKQHILNGGLLCADFLTAVDCQLSEDPVEVHWDYEVFQGWCLEYYHSCLPPRPKGGAS